MKKISFIISCILIIVLMSCHNRTSKKERLEQAVTEFNKNIKLIDIDNYYPVSYTEIKTDSLIANTFKVSIKNYANMDSEIQLSQRINQLKKTTNYHRTFASEIRVVVQDKIIFETHISAENFIDYLPSDFWNNATLEHVWVNQEQSDSEKLSLGLSFINPLQQSHKLYNLRIDKQGKQRLTLLEDHI
ncbi:hypothetical protein [Psychroserpens algicola]|uniref:Uncharacterized protein n=1 Tax=Psychroserpens algicola TaxID=1719034 RepID=A0ABT0HAX2_9FLAO|nr:hypothetical protein [Psychroserpens algicola]MCK8481496.1 hypothetical protein [Psychroserpens algicola]